MNCLNLQCAHLISLECIRIETAGKKTVQMIFPHWLLILHVRIFPNRINNPKHFNMIRCHLKGFESIKNSMTRIFAPVFFVFSQWSSEWNSNKMKNDLLGDWSLGTRLNTMQSNFYVDSFWEIFFSKVIAKEWNEKKGAIQTDSSFWIKDLRKINSRLSNSHSSCL